MVDSNKKFRIAIDAMGGDYAPLEIVKGGIKAAQEPGIHVILVGKKLLSKIWLSKNLPKEFNLILRFMMHQVIYPWMKRILLGLPIVTGKQIGRAHV